MLAYSIRPHAHTPDLMRVAVIYCAEESGTAIAILNVTASRLILIQIIPWRVVPSDSILKNFMREVADFSRLHIHPHVRFCYSTPGTLADLTDAEWLIFHWPEEAARHPGILHLRHPEFFIPTAHADPVMTGILDFAHAVTTTPPPEIPESGWSYYYDEAQDHYAAHVFDGEARIRSLLTGP